MQSSGARLAAVTLDGTLESGGGRTEGIAPRMKQYSEVKSLLNNDDQKHA